MELIKSSDVNISFDFDGTLNTEKGLKCFKKLKNDGHNISVTTTRREVDKNQDLWKLCEELEIDNVVFTNLNHKWDYLHDIDIHIDNDHKELVLIQQYSHVIPLLITDECFESNLEKVLYEIKF
jgi:MoaA/NifB/PqqE/SkfB family radical SAM enzyme